MAGRQPDFYSAAGNPVYRETDPKTRRTALIVVMPNGKAYFADAEGRPTRPSTTNPAAGAVIGGLVGWLWGPWGALVGASIGAMVANGMKQPAGPGAGGVPGA